MQRRAEKEFQENLRNELYYQEGEEAAIAKQRAEAEKRDRVRMELQEAKDFQLRLKAELSWTVNYDVHLENEYLLFST